MLRAVIIASNFGTICFSHYFDFVLYPERAGLEKELVEKCLAKGEKEHVFRDHERTISGLFKRQGMLMFVVTATAETSESVLHEFLHIFVDTVTIHLKLQNEKQILQHAANINGVLVRMVSHGRIIETRPSHILGCSTEKAE